MPILAVAVIFATRLACSIYVSGPVILLTFIQLFVMWHAITEPYFAILQNMSGGSQ